MTHTFVTTTAPTFSTLFVRHLFTGSTYSPVTQGAITSIDYSEDRQGLAYGSFVIVQNGVTYEALFPNGSTFYGPWQTATLPGLHPSNFIPAPGPNFSATGAPMQFGFIRGTTQRFAPITMSHDIDNWRVVVRR